jgi:hypothetical protein
VPDLLLADYALEALVVPLLGLVLHLLHARAKRLPASVAPRKNVERQNVKIQKFKKL